MEEIKAGDFIRTKGGDIGQVLKVIPESKYTTRIGRIAHSPEKYWIDTRKGSMSKPYIKKHSSNIIDLIEEGDIIEYKSEQGYDNIIEEVWKVENNNVLTIDGTRINIERVASIVTKEQFNQMKYIVGDESNVKD